MTMPAIADIAMAIRKDCWRASETLTWIIWQRRGDRHRTRRSLTRANRKKMTDCKSPPILQGQMVDDGKWAFNGFLVESHARLWR